MTAPTPAQLMRMTFVQRRAALAKHGRPEPVEAAPEPLPPVEHPDFTRDEMLAGTRAYRRWLYDPAKHPEPTPEQHDARRAYAYLTSLRSRDRARARRTGGTP